MAIKRAIQILKKIIYETHTYACLSIHLCIYMYQCMFIQFIYLLTFKLIFWKWMHLLWRECLRSGAKHLRLTQTEQQTLTFAKGCRLPFQFAIYEHAPPQARPREKINLGAKCTHRKAKHPWQFKQKMWRRATTATACFMGPHL